MNTFNSGSSISDLVVVGASAGGIGALSTLVSTLHKKFPAPIVLAQHLDPQRPSQLGAILERRSTLPVIIVDEQSPTPLENGMVYVVPANRHVKIVDGHVHLEGEGEDRPKPSVDLLLSSAAESYGEHLIAVILTGSGSDGAAGAVDVKNAGGVVIIQNPETAPYPSMPLSLPPTAVDHSVDVEQIGPLLFDLLKGVQFPAPEKMEDPLRDLLNQVTAQTNVDFRNYKSATILRRIARRMAVTHNSTFTDYTDYLRTHPDEIGELVKVFLIKVTGFFRDREAFDFLKGTVIAELIEKGKKNGHTLRLWCAGCATGEAAYSLAMLLADELGEDFPAWNIKIFATDLAADAITFARRGVYPENVLRELPNDYRERFFERSDHGYAVLKALRQVVIFGQQDISRGVPFPRIDLVTCRNLLIYLKQDLQQVVLDLFAYSLYHSRGYLFLGKAETARPIKANFEVVNKKWKIYRCVAGHVGFPAQDSSILPTTGREPRRSTFPMTHTSIPLHMGQSETDTTQLRRINETVLRHTTAAIVIIDRTYRILTINASARRLLGIRDLAYDQDFLHTVRGLPYHEVRRAIDTAFHERSTMVLQELEMDRTEGSARHLSLTVTPMLVEQNAPDIAVLTIFDSTDQVQLKKRLEAVQSEQHELVGELSTANKRFSTLNKELQDANEELQAANEELMLTQEELQATNEEIEATNEELQATNEELETNNEELQATNEELQTTNDELGARTTELQDVTRKHLGEQQQLSSLLERYPDYVMVLNARDLTIQTINPRYGQLFDGRDVIGQPVGQVFRGSDLSHLVELLKNSARDGKPVTTPPLKVNAEGKNTEAKFIHSIVPIVSQSGSIVDRLFIYRERSVE